MNVSRETWPPLDPPSFRRRLGCDVSDEAFERLSRHYETLREWNRRLALVGPEAGEVEPAIRHFGESLAALEWLPETEGTGLLDLGSGGGFPGLVLASARPDLDVTLVESRQKKCAFLETVARRCRLSVDILDVRVSRPLPRRLPEDVSAITLRAIRFSLPVLEALANRYPSASWIFWAGARLPEVPAEWRLTDEKALTGGDRRRILRWVTR